MGFINKLQEYQGLFEVLTIGKVSDGWINITNSICFTDLPVGVVSSKYFHDLAYENVSVFDYTKEVTYYCYYKPVSYVKFKHIFNLNDSLIELLKNYDVNIYEVEIIYEKNLKENGGFRNIKQKHCYQYKREDYRTVAIQTPRNLLKKDVTITINSYYPNKIFILEENIC